MKKDSFANKSMEIDERKLSKQKKEVNISTREHTRCDFLKTIGLSAASLMLVNCISCGVVVGRGRPAEAELSAGAK